MTRSFGLVDYKVREADYFLGQTRREAAKLHFYEMQYCVSAFVSAARSITFAMQASIRGVPGFDEWYAERQARLRADPLARFFHAFRTVSQHLGENVVSGGSSSGDGYVYYFVACADLPVVPDQDVISACTEYFTMLLNLVFDCYVDFGPVIDGQQRYTADFFASLGKCIEDAEAELGFPRGHTDIGDPAALPWRWETIRNAADGCQIGEYFEKWLGKGLPRPARLPRYHR